MVVPAPRLGLLQIFHLLWEAVVTAFGVKQDILKALPQAVPGVELGLDGLGPPPHDDLVAEVRLPKDLVAQLPEVGHLLIPNAEEDQAIFRQKIPGQQQAGVQDGAPVRVKAAIALCIFKELQPLLVVHAQLLVLRPLGALPPVPIDKIVPGIVGRVQIDQTHLSLVAPPEDLQGIQVLPLDVQVPGGLPVPAVLPHRTQGEGGGLGGLRPGRILSHPGELVALLPLYHVGGEERLQRLQVYRPPQRSVLSPALCHHRGKEPRDRLQILLLLTGAPPFLFLHVSSPVF